MPAQRPVIGLTTYRERTRFGVWDTTADTRYMVLPERPAETNGWSEDRLAEIVTRDSLIGVARL